MATAGDVCGVLPLRAGSATSVIRSECRYARPAATGTPPMFVVHLALGAPFLTSFARTAA